MQRQFTSHLIPGPCLQTSQATHSPARKWQQCGLSLADHTDVWVTEFFFSASIKQKLAQHCKSNYTLIIIKKKSPNIGLSCGCKSWVLLCNLGQMTSLSPLALICRMKLIILPYNDACMGSIMRFLKLNTMCLQEPVSLPALSKWWLVLITWKVARLLPGRW